MKSETNAKEGENTSLKLKTRESGMASDGNATSGSGYTRREFCQAGGIVGGLAAAAAVSNLLPGAAQAADVVPDFTALDETRKTGPDFSKIPQRLHEYPACERAKEIVRKSITMDSLFSGVWPMQWSSPEAPEFHDEMDRCKEAGFKVLAACPSTDSADASMLGIVKAVEFYLKKLNERPEKYKIVRNAEDIDDAITKNKLGIFFTHQGSALFGGDLDRVGLFRQLGYGYCLLAYNTRNTVGDGCFEPDNGRLTGYGKLLIDAYNRYGMIVDVSHTANRTALDAIERSQQPVISSHSLAKSVVDYQRSISDEVIKGIAASGGVCCINMVGAFVDLSNPDIVTTDMLFRHIDYMVNLAGIDHVGFGSDYIPDMTQTAIACQSPLGDLFFPDGGYTRKMAAKGCPTPAPYQIVAALVDKLLEKGYSERDCSKFLGGNLHRVFKKVWG